jgi:hypothetical protein
MHAHLICCPPLSRAVHNDLARNDGSAQIAQSDAGSGVRRTVARPPLRQIGGNARGWKAALPPQSPPRSRRTPCAPPFWAPTMAWSPTSAW